MILHWAVVISFLLSIGKPTMAMQGRITWYNQDGRDLCCRRYHYSSEYAWVSADCSIARRYSWAYVVNPKNGKKMFLPVHDCGYLFEDDVIVDLPEHVSAWFNDGKADTFSGVVVLYRRSEDAGSYNRKLGWSEAVVLSKSLPYGFGASRTSK